MKRRFINIFTLFAFIAVIMAACGIQEQESALTQESNETTSTETKEEPTESHASEQLEIVASNGFVYERGERNIELMYESDFDTYIEENYKVFVVFYATWCRFCQQLDTQLPDLLEEVEDLLIVNVDIEIHPRLADAFQAIGTPTVVYFYKNHHPTGFRGAPPTETIIEFLHEASK